MIGDDNLQATSRKTHGDQTDRLFSFWRNLQEKRGARATLTRASTLSEVCFLPEFVAFRQQVLPGRYVIRSRMDERCALALVCLALIREHDDTPIPKALGRKTKNEDPKLKQQRFRRLLEADSPAEQHRLFSRAIRLLESKANLEDAVEAALAWNDQCRRKWAIKYYETP